MILSRISLMEAAPAASLITNLRKHGINYHPSKVQKKKIDKTIKFGELLNLAVSESFFQGEKFYWTHSGWRKHERGLQ